MWKVSPGDRQIHDDEHRIAVWAVSPLKTCVFSRENQEEAASNRNRQAETKTDQPRNHTNKQTSKQTNNQMQYILESCRIIL